MRILLSWVLCCALVTPSLAVVPRVLYTDETGNPITPLQVPWSDLTEMPTTLAGYGLTDAQPLDSDLTAIAALSTTSYGRNLLTLANQAALAAAVGSNNATNVTSGTLDPARLSARVPLLNATTNNLALPESFSAAGSLSSDGGSINSSGYGDLQVGATFQVNGASSLDGGNISSDGGGDLTIDGVFSVMDSASFDDGLVATDGNGGLQLSSLSAALNLTYGNYTLPLNDSHPMDAVTMGHNFIVVPQTGENRTYFDTYTAGFEFTKTMFFDGGISASSLRDVAAPAYATTVTPTLTSNRNLIVNVGTLTGPVTIGPPTGSSLDDGTTIIVRLREDSTGGRAIALDASYAVGSNPTVAQINTGAGNGIELKFEYDAPETKWRYVGLAQGF